MTFIATKPDTSGKSVKLFYEERGTGKTVILIHGWPLNHEMWEYQLNELPKSNIRCIAYDRRGFGRSDRPYEKYDFDTLADDLKALIDQLNLKEVTLVGFSMGGGEIARYIGKYGSDNIEKVIFVSSVTPYLLNPQNNGEGVNKSIFDDMVEQIKDDRPAFLAEFAKKFYGVSMINRAVSQPLLDWNQSLCMMSSSKATIDCMRSFSETDFRADLKKINIPTLIIHGDDDHIVPIDISSKITEKMIPHSKYIVYADAPHGLFITEKEKLNRDLINFIHSKFTVNEVADSIKSFQLAY